ncbi:MAG: GntR family transcriptional regulator [Hyphomicrobiales bacterium]|nr:GntR family transcriptional regulator [Hyphomicrobiales bacterium]
MFTLDSSETTNPSEPIARRVVRLLRHAIVTMRIRPGEKLSEQETAKRLGVSRQPVREAFIKLAEAGLVLILPQRGTLVVKISVAAVENARFIREAIECAVVREAVRRKDRDALDVARGVLDETARAIVTGDAERLFELDEEFHRALAAAAGRPDAWRVVEEQKAQMDRVRYLDMTDAIPMRIVLAQHLAILDAIEAGDAELAERELRAHLREILVSLPKLAARWPTLFEAPAAAAPTPTAGDA